MTIYKVNFFSLGTYSIVEIVFRPLFVHLFLITLLLFRSINLPLNHFSRAITEAYNATDTDDAWNAAD